MKKVCIISPGSYSLLANQSERSHGGAEAQLKTLGFALSQLKYEVHFIVDDYGQSDLEVIRDIIVHKVPLKYMGGSNLYLPYSWLKLFLTLFRIGADIHLIKNPRNLLFPIGIFCRVFKKKLIFIGQMDDDADPTFLKKIDRVPLYLLFRAGMRFVGYTVAQNEKQRWGFQNNYNKKSQLIKNTLTLPMPSAHFSKKGYILWVGNDLPKKQPEKYLDLATKLPQYKFKMILSPASGAERMNLIKNRADSIPNLECLGFVPFNEIAKYFQGAALFISTSLREGFPNTFLQAWQFGTPVVSLNLDPDDVIKKHELGHCAATFAELCQSVEELMGNEEKRIEMGKNASNYVTNEHAPERIVNQYINLFEML